MRTLTLLTIGCAIFLGCRGDTGTSSRRLTDDVEVEHPAGITQAADLSGVIILSAEQNYTCAVVDKGTPYCWGQNHKEQFGHQDILSSATPVSPPTPLEPFTHLSAGLSRVCAQTEKGETYCWGHTDVGLLAHRKLSQPYLVQGLPKLEVLDTGALFDCGVTAEQRVYCWFIYWSEENKQFQNAFYMPNTEAVSVGVGGLHACGLDEDGFVSCWGEWDVTLGPIWNQSPENTGSPGKPFELNGISATPIRAWRVPLPASTTKIAVGGRHTCALLDTGAVYCWGYNWGGELGLPLSTDISATPVQVIASGATDVHAGNWLTCARLQSGDFSCWGEWIFDSEDMDACIQRSVPEDSCIRRPTSAPLPRNLSLLAIGNYHLCYYSDRIQCVGWDRYGQLGLGEPASTSTLP